MDIEPYKSLRSAIFEVQAAAVPVKPADKKPAAKTAHKVGEPWQTASGSHWHFTVTGSGSRTRRSLRLETVGWVGGKKGGG